MLVKIKDYDYKSEKWIVNIYKYYLKQIKRMSVFIYHYAHYAVVKHEDKILIKWIAKTMFESSKFMENHNGICSSTINHIIIQIKKLKAISIYPVINNHVSHIEWYIKEIINTFGMNRNIIWDYFWETQEVDLMNEEF